ncbi:MAG: tryptophan 2,3-dioxygenase family protein [Rhodospirillaceae bacterium]|nr:tryptophan 2,3-dioxygenase family protein [Rhodospirillaceae bacterium]MDD9999223.1 tryptophan 2,3-dioxygenase family protein [Rhodospirillaceae bacterium]
MTSTPQNYREMETSIHADLRGKMSYDKYLRLHDILNAQKRLSNQHDEMLFIVIHQASELWLKLACHEVAAAIRNIRNDDLRQAFKVIARVKLILTQLTQSWSILSTMTPVDYLKFRDTLGPASGFQSYCYRKLEFLLGNKNIKLIEVHRHVPEVYEELKRILVEPGLYDVVLRKLRESGFEIDEQKLERDYSLPYEANDSVQAAWHMIYADPETYFELYELAEKLVDVEDSFQLWRFKHMYTVQRIIGTRRGTGGSSGVPFLRRAIETSFFPELFAIRSEL